MKAQDKGRKRHIATDTIGLLLAAVVTAASVQDTNGGKDVASKLAASCPSVTAGWVDSGCKSGFLAHAASCGISFEVVAKPDGQKGFAPLPRRWAVERTIGWLMLHRRLARDYELPRHRGNSYYPEALVIPA